jgi:D-alanyl-D-alanine carboxypeptidase
MDKGKKKAKRDLLTITALVSIAVGFLGGCGNSSTPDYGVSLQQMVTQKWDEYGKGIGHPHIGGAALHISSPKGSYFASTNMDNASPDIHFRAASNTKTFTAAAIMLLYQRGQLNIDDVITAQIPGKDMPYVPDSPSYAIPYKDSITIRQLLSHRAGVFDVTNSKIPADAPCPFAGEDYADAQAPTHQFTFDELVGVVAECDLSYWAPWLNQYKYSNTGYNLLGKISER